MGSRSSGWRVLPLRGDGDAVFEEAEHLKAPEGEEVVLFGWLDEPKAWSVGVVGPVEPHVSEIGEVGERGGDDARERVAV